MHAKRKSKTKVFFCDMFCRNFPSSGKFALQHFIELSGYGVWQHSGLGLVCMCYVAIAQRFTQRCHHRNPLSPSLKVVTGAGKELYSDRTQRADTRDRVTQHGSVLTRFNLLCFEANVR